MSRTLSYLWLALMLASSWLYLVGHSRYGLFDVDEAIFTQATIEMRHSEHFAMPTYNAEPRYHKPPLIYWLQAASMEVLGEDSLLAARLPSGLAALGTILLLGFAVTRLTGNAQWGFISALCLAINLSFLVIGRAAIADAVLNLTSLALALWVIHVLYPSTPVLPPPTKGQPATLPQRLAAVKRQQTYLRWQWLITGTLAALALLAKGPVAGLPAFLIAATVWFARPNKSSVIQQLAPVRTTLLMLALLTPWFATLVLQHGLGFFYEFIMVHNVSRFTSDLGNTQSKSHLFYLGVLLVGFFPWVLLLPSALAALVHSWRGKGQPRRWQRFLASINGEHVSTALPALALVWAVGYIGFFSFSGTKLSHYILPAYPALAILLGWWSTLSPTTASPKLAGGTRLTGVVIIALFASLFAVLVPLLEGLRHTPLTGALAWLQTLFGFTWPVRDAIAAAVLAQTVPLNPAPYVIAGLMLTALIPAWWHTALGRPHGFITLGGVWAVCLGLISWAVVPMVWGYTQAPLAQLAQVIKAAPTTSPVIHLGLHKPSVLYLSHRPFLKLEQPLQLPEYILAPETLVLTELPTVPAIAAELTAKGVGAVVGQRCLGGYCLLIVAKVALPTLTTPALDTLPTPAP